MLGIGMPYWIMIGSIMLVSWLVQWNLKRKFEKYTQIPLRSGMSGKEVAEKMLRESGVQDVDILSVQGRLTDHYNPMDKTVNLSPEVYSGRSVMAAAVAAHECGHAIQHAKSYAFLGMRSKLVPIISISSKYMQWVILIGFFVFSSFPALLWIGIGMFATTTLFSFVTLPVEFDATNRAKAWLNDSNLTTSQEHAGVSDALGAAAMTYVVAALSSLATLLYYISLALGRRD
ncbi:MAG: zinc metallopeptidase [Chitinophagales bacterium]